VAVELAPTPTPTPEPSLTPTPTATPKPRRPWGALAGPVRWLPAWMMIDCVS